MIKSVIFDCDGVIVNSEELCWSYFYKAALEYDFDFSKELYHKFCGGSFKTMSEEERSLFPKDENVFKEIMQKGGTAFHKRLEEGGPVDLKPYVNEIVSSLDAEGIDMYIGSSTVHDGVIQRIGPWGLEKYFKGIVSGDMVKNKKPDPEIYNLVCSKYGIDKSIAVVIEDSANGIISAHTAGLRVIAVADLWPMDEFEEKGYCVCKENLLDALHYIEEENKKGGN